MNICILAAGAAGMYCGSCMRDNALAAALKRMGHSITLVPLYTPLKTEPQSVSENEVFFGGVNVYLQHATRVFRHTPRFVDWVLDRPWLLKLAGNYGSSTPPEELAELTLSLLRGEEGPAVKELRRLLAHLKNDVRPQVVTIPNLMFLGVARAIKQEMGVPIVCELTGEDIFLDAMREKDRDEIQSEIRRRAGDVSRYIATCDYYADRMADYLTVPRDKIDVVYPGIASEYFSSVPNRPSSNGHLPTIGYMARICPEKGLERLIDAVIALHRMPGSPDFRVKVAGYVGKGHEAWYEVQQKRAADAGLSEKIQFNGEIERDAKLALLDSIDVLCVPTVYPESKGVFVLEALARGVPVVQPAHGSFPELIRLTGGGVLVPPGDAGALAEALAGLLRDRDRLRLLGAAGQRAAREHFTDDQMAKNMLRVFESVAA